MPNPWNGKAVLQAFWWNCANAQYSSWYTYLAKLAPRLAAMGFDGIWTPQPCKANGIFSNMGYAPYDYYDLGQKNQQGGVGTWFGTQDEFLRMIAVCHANGLEVYPDIVLDHSGGAINKTYQLSGFAGAGTGRWPRSWLDFHPNPDHEGCFGEWCVDRFDDDICYRGRCSDSGTVNPETYMRPMARAWFEWLIKQSGVDGFRFDDVKDYPPEIVEDLLWNAMGDRIDYFCVGEFIPNGPGSMDQWTAAVNGRSGTFDYDLRPALVNMVYYPDSFDMGSLPNYQQKSRLKTVPFVNNHDLWHGEFWDSSGDNQTDHTGYPQNANEKLGPTLDPDNPRTPLAYAFAVTIDGNPLFFYEDLFRNFEPYRSSTTADAIPTRPWIENLVWCHQKLAVKSGDYFVRYQNSQKFLILERGARAIVAINNDDNWNSQWISTAFFPNTQLHDYSGSRPDDIWTNQDGWVEIAVPPCSYSVWGPAGVTGGFSPAARRTVQQFEMADDLGDNDAGTPRYGGNAVPTIYRTAGAIWPAAASQVNVAIYSNASEQVDLQIQPPAGAPAIPAFLNGAAASTAPFAASFSVAAEGRHVLTARLSNVGAPPARLYVKVDYMGPAASALF